MTKNKTNYASALRVLAGTDVVAHDRRKADAHPVDFTTTIRAKEYVLRPAYGISHVMHTRLEGLATLVEFVDGMPEYHFAK